MTNPTEAPAGPDGGSPPGPLDRALRLFGDARAGEGATVLLMCLSVFLLLTAHYVLKTVREPLILLAGGAELKSYAAGAQAQLFYLAHKAGLPHLGFVFFVWVGIFSLTTIAQFWSYANEVYSRPEGDRLFPLIAIGSTAGAPLGAALASRLFGLGLSPFLMMEVAAALLGVHLVLYRVIAARMGSRPGRAAVAPMKAGNGFALVLKSPYLRLVALLLVALNFLGTHIVHRGVPGFARLNMIFVVIALGLAALVVREHRRLTAPERPAPATGVAA